MLGILGLFCGSSLGLGSGVSGDVLGDKISLLEFFDQVFGRVESMGWEFTLPCMDTDEPRSQKLKAMECKGPDDHACEVSTKEITSGRHLGGHMSCHRHADMQSKSTPRPPPTTVDLSVSLLGPSDEKPSLLSLETQCMQCFEEFSTCQSMRWDMRMYSEEKVTAKPDKEPAVLTEASAKANGDRWQNMMLFSPAKRKHQKHYLMECIMQVGSMGTAPKTLHNLVELGDTSGALGGGEHGECEEGMKAFMDTLLYDCLLNEDVQVDQPQSRKRKRSEIWLHFTKIYTTDPKRVYAVCHCCDRGYKAHPKKDGTSHLKRHK
ncbi:hypothetical protein HU200_003450 [Digitaria exilis]|uniref:BED-type domain-containing protein n=1 Tax=Digitaria exilis TaxID=1010633 RepID=A0A835FX22_9POAL|nr:hypothetical protein HU200_003450 [Digitaria exilis]